MKQHEKYIRTAQHEHKDAPKSGKRRVSKAMRQASKSLAFFEGKLKELEDEDEEGDSCVSFCEYTYDFPYGDY